jgi:hypothetical protein
VEDDPLLPNPTYRKLRIFALDPGLSAQYNTAGISQITISVPWEEKLMPGPVGEYLEVVDADPASEVFYKPIDLNDPRILAQDGLAPSETNPMFHQQMVYAVAMATIGHFEQALGRVALWASRQEEYRLNPNQRPRYRSFFVPRLRIYPHALREGNAYYSPNKKALLFGYFTVGLKDASNTPGTVVFTCLSHDIIAHETTHALLDGVHPRFNEPVNEDVLAFHEAFADIVALFQHFSYPGVLRDQIARTRGNLAGENLLAQIAQQFGQASGRGTALRDALGGMNKKTGLWERRKPDVRALESTSEPHDRGALLVAAVFGAFLKVYRARTVDLYRIASEGTGVLREGDIHPDLANRFAEEATRCAAYVLQMCIRAIDYCPPVGITFGDYLRAVVTADFDLNPDDVNGYRLAFVESFREWGIHPVGMRSMSIDALLWPTGTVAADLVGVTLSPDAIRELFAYKYHGDDEETNDRSTRLKEVEFQPWNLETDRYKTWKGIDDNAYALWGWLVIGPGQALAKVIGIVLGDPATLPSTVFRSDKGHVSTEVHSVRTSVRRGVRGGTITDLVVEITQRRRGYFDKDVQKQKDQAVQFDPDEQADFFYRAGCTLIINTVSREVRRVIRTAGTITDDLQLERVRTYLADGGLRPANAFSPTRNMYNPDEPFALLHHREES